MVTITGYKQHQTQDGRSFFSLQLQGGLEIVQSAMTGKSYATVRRSSMPTTFDEATCKLLVGSTLPGSIQRVECQPYSYVVESTGEEITLMHRWEYQGENSLVPELA